MLSLIEDVARQSPKAKEGETRACDQHETGECQQDAHDHQEPTENEKHAVHS